MKSVMTQFDLAQGKLHIVACVSKMYIIINILSLMTVLSLNERL